MIDKFMNMLNKYVKFTTKYVYGFKIVNVLIGIVIVVLWIVFLIVVSYFVA
jgi:hypothetical protein